MNTQTTKIKTTAEQVADQIKRSIFNRKFLPGSKLVGSYICNWLEVSRTPVREALFMLEAEGLVEIYHNKGVYVTQITIEDLEELYELRNIIEIYSIRKFVTLSSEENLREMENLLKDMDNLVKQKDYAGYFDLAIDFHGYYISKCRNKFIYSVFSRIRNSIRSTQFLLSNEMSYRERSLEEHKEILQAIIERDSDKSEKLLKQHLYAGFKNKKKRLKAILDS